MGSSTVTPTGIMSPWLNSRTSAGRRPTPMYQQGARVPAQQASVSAVDAPAPAQAPVPNANGGGSPPPANSGS
jgi:hypothetical protein